jgi:hypothetical protein
MSRTGRVTFTVLSICVFVLLMAFTVYSAVDQKTLATSGPWFSDWSKPGPVAGLNTSFQDVPNGISRDGLSLYFQRTNPGTGEDLYVVHRPDLESNWGVPIKLPETINSTFTDRAAFVSSDGHWLFFSSDRPGGIGGNDLYLSRRTHVHDDGDWEPAVNLSAVNSVGFESGPTLFEDEETDSTQLYFNSAPFPGGTQAVADIYRSTFGPNGFEAPIPVTELNSPVQEGRPYLRRDGREIYMQSNRSGLLSIWVSTRSSTTEPWSPPEVAVSPANMGDATVVAITTPVLSWDNSTLFVGVIRPGVDMGDIYVATREKVKGRKPTFPF